MLKMGVIGFGSRISGMIRTIQKQDPNCQITAIVDINHAKIQESTPKELSDTRFYRTVEEMIASESLDGILIGTRCSLHTQMALKVLPHGIPLFLEKPVATTMEDLIRLKSGLEASNSQVLVSFPLRVTSLVKLVKEIIDSGKIGTVEHVQAVNNVTYGGVYYHNWYRDEKETGGLFLQKATHDLDYINHVLGIKPVSICAMTSKQVFTGDKPAGLKCVDCEDNRICEESTAFDDKYREIWTHCCFAEDTGNEDSGSALIRYESGMHVSYSQNFFVRNDAGSRGARFMGYKGTLEFDFYTNKVQVFMHHTPRVETYEVKPGKDHFGGDAALAQNFIDIMQGQSPSICSLEEGMMSALMCLKPRKSAKTEAFQKIEY